MNKKSFANLPFEVVIDILSRLPVRTIISCKCVCKLWLNLVETHEFVKTHLSKSVLGLATCQSAENSESYKILEFEDGLDIEHNHELRYSLVTSFDLPLHGRVQDSVNGLLFLRDVNIRLNDLYVCNPITRDYIKIPSSEELLCPRHQVVAFGFGVTKMTGQYKVVRNIFSDCAHDQQELKSRRNVKSKCQVYTLGTGVWRSIPHGAFFTYYCRSSGTYLNGNLHWLSLDMSAHRWISCFDLETELFSTFAPPPFQGTGRFLTGPFALRDCLCVCRSTLNDEIVIWLMKEYRVETSWTKEFVIKRSPDLVEEYYMDFCPIRVFKDDGILMVWDDNFLFYSKRTNSTQVMDMFELPNCQDAILHTPSFFSLKSFVLENVSSF